MILDLLLLAGIV